MSKNSAGKIFRQALQDALADGAPLHIIGVGDGSDALEAEKAGFKAIYASGSQIAASRGWADIGRIELKHVVENVQRILDSGTKLPLLVDIDTGFNDVAETIRTLEALGVAAVHLEDQQDLKACGHLPGKHVVSKEEATARIKRAVDAKKDTDFVIMARTDALAAEADTLAAELGKKKDDPAIEKEALVRTLARIESYSKAGADMIFAEAFPDAASYQQVKKAAGGKPVLANMTEFGKVDLKTPKEIGAESGGAVDIVLNPLTVYRAQRQTAAEMYPAIFAQGTQRGMEPELQTREYFQKLIDYPGQVADRAKQIAEQDSAGKITPPPASKP